MEAEKQTEKTAGNPNTEGTTVQTDAPGQEPGMKLFAGDKVLWIIIAALAVISVLVVYSSTGRWPTMRIRLVRRPTSCANSC